MLRKLGAVLGTIVFAGAVIVLVAMWYFKSFVFVAPDTFPVDEFVRIEQGASILTIANQLEEMQVITSAWWFRALVYAAGEENTFKSGTYSFSEPQDMGEIFTALATGDYGTASVRLTILEGTASYSFVPEIADKLLYVTEEDLNQVIVDEDREGYLYPDTYFFSKDATVDDVFAKIQNNFDKKIEPHQSKIDASGYTLDEILTMASLVENEAGSASYETKQRVAGVLFKRLEIGMPLQADAVFSFIYKQHLPRVLFSHLEVDSPYNVYKNPGLPPGPIGNPSIESIRATLDPIVTDDLYYLTGFDGNFYYSPTLAGHERNRREYLNYK